MASFFCCVSLRLAQIASSSSILGLSIYAKVNLSAVPTHHGANPYLLCDYSKFFIFIGIFALFYTTIYLVLDFFCYICRDNAKLNWQIIRACIQIFSVNQRGQRLMLDIADFSTFFLSMVACASLSAELANGVDPLSNKVHGRSPLSKSLVALSGFLACLSLIAGLSSHPKTKSQSRGTMATGNTSLSSSDYHFSTGDTAIDDIIDAVKA